MIKEFCKEIFLRRFGITWSVITGFITVFSYISLGKEQYEKILVALSTIIIFYSFRIIYYAYIFFEKGLQPISVRRTELGTNYFLGRTIIILDKRNWLQRDHLLELNVISDSVQTPLGIIRVEAFTSKGFAQALFTSFATEFTETYINDPSRWRSLVAIPIITNRNFNYRS